MRPPRQWKRLFRFPRSTPAADVDAELRFHFDERIADLVATGESRESAAHRAAAEFGDAQAVRATLVEIDTRLVHQHRRADWWERVEQDVRYALRGIRRSPGFTVMVVLTLALGLGANAALFSVADRMFLRAPSGVNRPDQVRRLQQHFTDANRLKIGAPAAGIRSVYNYPEVRAIKAALGDSVLLAGYRFDKVQLGPDGDSPDGVASYVVGDYFGVVDVRPAAGRFFTANEERVENTTPLAVISHALWLNRYGGEQEAIGKTVQIGSRSYEIIGVAPKAFRGIDLDAVTLWVPMSTIGRSDSKTPWYESRNSYFIRIITRASSAAAVQRIELASAMALRSSARARDSSATVTLASVIEAVWPDAGAKEITITTRLVGVAMIILLIACANVANLLLMRAMQRRREIAVRLALGVSRSRLVGQLLTESVVIAFIASAVALIVAAWGGTALRHLLLPDVRWAEPAVGFRMAAFTALLAMLTGIGAALLPALQSTRPDLSRSLKAGAREGTFRRSRLRSSLLVMQGALSVVLLAGAGLFVRSLQGVEAVNIGYESDRLVFASVGYEQEIHGPEVAAGLPALVERVRRLRGVQQVALAENMPMWAFSWLSVFLRDRDSVPTLNGGAPFVSFVSPEFLATVGIVVRSGRGLSADDRAGTEPVIVVSSSLAKTYWPGENATGKCIILDKRGDPCRTVVGVVSETHFAGIIEDASMHIYIPLAQMPARSAGALAIRVLPGWSAPVASETRGLLKSAFGSWARPRVLPMSEILAPELRPWRLGASLFLAAGLLALAVAAVGVYSTIAYTVTQRTHEMGVRVALGAGTANIVRLIVGEGVRVVAVGVVVGAAMALALGRVVASMLYKISPHDPGVLIAVSLMLLAVAIGACLVPAWRATRVDPVRALQTE